MSLSKQTLLLSWDHPTEGRGPSDETEPSARLRCKRPAHGPGSRDANTAHVEKNDCCPVTVAKREHCHRCSHQCSCRANVTTMTLEAQRATAGPLPRQGQLSSHAKCFTITNIPAPHIPPHTVPTATSELCRDHPATPPQSPNSPARSLHGSFQQRLPEMCARASTAQYLGDRGWVAR